MTDPRSQTTALASGPAPAPLGPGRPGGRQRPLALLGPRILLPLAALASGCVGGGAEADDGRIQAVATTSIVADMVRQVGGEHVSVQALMGPNVDPHLYRPSEGDVTRMATADIVFTNGLHLEGKMGEALEQLGSRGTIVRAVAEAIPEACAASRSRSRAPTTRTSG